MRPLQILLPLIGGGLGDPRARRDATRACQTWNGEDRIWMVSNLPPTSTPVWKEEWEGRQVRLRAIVAEEFNRVDIDHVGENGFVDGPPVPGGFAEIKVDGLLKAWLEWPERGTIEWKQPAPLAIDVPVFRGNEVTYVPSELAPVPRVTVPIREPESSAFQVPGASHQPISPETELAEANERTLGTLATKIVDDRVLVTSANDPDFLSAGATLWAAPPLEGLFPTGVNLDAIFHCAKMASVLRQSRSDLKGALKRARDWSTEYVTVGRSDLDHSWFRPTLAEVKDVDFVIRRGETHGLTDARTWEEASASNAWREKMTAPIPIRRAWGAIGLFWALVLDELENAQPQAFCDRCGRQIKARTRRKTFCSREENEDCYRARRAADRRRDRAR